MIDLAEASAPTILTVGHSTRSLDAFVALLRVHRVVQLADIRTVPKSRRHPHFAGDALASSLPAAGIAYRHFPALGGLRKPRRDSVNGAWQNDSFRGYADHMQTPAFERGLDELIAWAQAGRVEGNGGRTVVMCAESVWWRCHRQLVADALIGRGLEVRHITSDAPAAPHALTAFARVDEAGRVTYPGLI